MGSNLSIGILLFFISAAWFSGDMGSRPVRVTHSSRFWSRLQHSQALPGVLAARFWAISGCVATQPGAAWGAGGQILGHSLLCCPAQPGVA